MNKETKQKPNGGLAASYANLFWEIATSKLFLGIHFFERSHKVLWVLQWWRNKLRENNSTHHQKCVPLNIICEQLFKPSCFWTDICLPQGFSVHNFFELQKQREWKITKHVQITACFCKKITSLLPNPHIFLNSCLFWTI